MCAEDIAEEDLVDCHTCYRCDKNFCEACCDGGLDGFPNDRISVSSIYSHWVTPRKARLQNGGFARVGHFRSQHALHCVFACAVCAYHAHDS